MASKKNSSIEEIAKIAHEKNWSKKVRRAKAEEYGIDPSELTKEVAKIEAAKNPKSVNQKMEDDEKEAARKEKEKEIESLKELKEKADRKATESIDRLKKELPASEMKLVELKGMLEDRTPRGVTAYVNAAISWQSHEPHNAAIRHAVTEFSKQGVKLKQRGNNNSWYGKTKDGEDIRIGDHLGKESHAIDIVFDAEKPLTREQVSEYLEEYL